MTGTPYCNINKIYLHGACYAPEKGTEMYLKREQDEQGEYHYYIINVENSMEIARFNFYNVDGVIWDGEMDL